MYVIGVYVKTEPHLPLKYKHKRLAYDIGYG